MKCPKGDDHDLVIIDEHLMCIKCAWCTVCDEEVL